MRSAQVAVLAVAVLVLAYATPVHASAWYCPRSIEEKLAEYESIFAGTVAAVVPFELTQQSPRISTAWKPSVIMTFDVHRVWKGKNRTTLTITAHAWRFDRKAPPVGDTYLIYARADSEEPTDYYTDFDCNNFRFTGQNYINPDGSSLGLILPNDLEALGTGKPAGQPPAFGVVLVVLGAAAVFVVLARAFLLWRWRRH